MTMRDYLEQRAGMEFRIHTANNSPTTYAGLCDFILDRGHPRPDSSPLTEEQFEYLTKVAKATTLRFEPKQCFHNAMMLAICDSNLEGRIEYIEGFAYTGALPVHHAWVELDGKLVDLTRSLRPNSAQEFINGKPPQADLRDRLLGVIPEGWEYLGVTFDSDEVQSYVWEHEETNSLITNYRDGFPKLKLERLSPLPQSVLSKAALFDRLQRMGG